MILVDLIRVSAGGLYMKYPIRLIINKHKWIGLIVLMACTFSMVYWVEASNLTQTAQEGQTIFTAQCAACHTIGGGDLVGPDLAGVTERRDLDWLLNFIKDPDEMINSGDPLANQLLAQYNNVRMPTLGLNQTQVESLLAHLELQGDGDGSEGAAVELPPGDAKRGGSLFDGGAAFSNGGLSCIACHNVGGVGKLGGGSLGPDLTNVYGRLGETGLAGALKSLPFATMQGVYAGKLLTEQEQADMLAFFMQADAEGQDLPPDVFTPQFWLWGGLGMVLLFGVMAIFWPRQRKSISQKLREGNNK